MEIGKIWNCNFIFMKNENVNDEEDSFRSFVEDFGIDKNIIDSFKPMIPALIAELIRGVPKFVAEDKNISELIQNSIKEKGGLLTQNIYSVRTFILTITGFSLTIIGVIFSVLSTSRNIFGHTIFLYTGLISLGINVIGSVVYILYLQTIENNKLYRHLNFDMRITKEMRGLLSTTYLDPTKTFSDYSESKKQLLKLNKKEEEDITGKNRKKKKDWRAHILSGFFLFGLILIVISFFWH